MKHRSKRLLLAALIAAFLSLASCQESSIEPEINTDPATEITENAEVSETPDALGDDSPDPIDYSDHDVIRALYEEQGYTVNKIYAFSENDIRALVEYYPTDSPTLDGEYVYYYEWIEMETGERTAVNYAYCGDRRTDAYGEHRMLVPDSLTILESGTTGQLVTLKYENGEATCTKEDYYREYTSEKLFWKQTGPDYCAYLEDIEYNFDSEDNSIRFGFKGNLYFDVPVAIMPSMLLRRGDPAEYYENAYAGMELPFIDDFASNDDGVFLIIFNTILGEDFTIPTQSEASGVCVTNVVCTGKDTVVEMSIDKELTCFTARMVWTQYEAEGKVSLHLLFADETARE